MLQEAGLTVLQIILQILVYGLKDHNLLHGSRLGLGLHGISLHGVGSLGLGLHGVSSLGLGLHSVGSLGLGLHGISLHGVGLLGLGLFLSLLLALLLSLLLGLGRSLLGLGLLLAGACCQGNSYDASHGHGQNFLHHGLSPFLKVD